MDLVSRIVKGEQIMRVFITVLILLGLSTACSAQVELESDYKRYSDKIAKDPDNELLYFNRASVLYEMGKFDESIEDVDMTLKIFPRHPGAYELKGMILMGKGKYADAVNAMEKSVELMCCQPHQIRNVMLAYLYNNQNDVAIRFFKERGNTYEGLMAAYLVPIAYQRLGQKEKAMELYNELIANMPDQPAYYLLRADLYYAMDMLEKSDKDIDKAKSLDLKFDRGFTLLYADWLDEKFLAKVKEIF